MNGIHDRIARFTDRNTLIRLRRGIDVPFEFVFAQMAMLVASQPLQCAVYDNAVEPRRKRFARIELVNLLVRAHKSLGHDVIGGLTISDDEISRAQRTQLMLLHQQFQPPDIATFQ